METTVFRPQEPSITGMSTFETLKSNLSIARTLIIEGRDRYIGVTRTAFAIEQIYRKHRQRAKGQPADIARNLLSQAHTDAARKICELCRDNGAIWVKFGQFLSCRPDILPLEYLHELQSLQNSASSVGFEALHPLILDSWGAEWDSHFRSFDALPVATASVAQVHRATLKDGRQVAVKFQLPDVRELFEQDSLVFGSLASVVAPLVKEIDIRQVTEQIIEMTMGELDFRREADNLRLFGSHAHAAGIRVPALVDELCNEKVLVTEWIEGVRLTDYIQQQPEQAKTVLTRLLHSFIQQVTQFGVYHADPHPGNFLVDAQGRIAILDYGALGYLSPQESTDYGQLLLGLMGVHQQPLGELFAKAGFTCPEAGVLERISTYFLDDDIDGMPPLVDVSERLTLVLEQLRKYRVKIPDSFISMARVIISIGGFMKQYDVDFSWQPAGTALDS